jgi:3-hydroxybutyryl-CoA dehydrogenase
MSAKRFVVVGCGLMGCDIAAIFLRAGWQAQGVQPGRDGWDEVRARTQSAVKQLDPDANADAFELHEHVEHVDWDGVDLLIEAIPENFELKRALFEALDQLAPPNVPLATNTSGLRITEIARNCVTASRMGGLHFFLPAHLVPAVEVVRGERTDDTTMDRMQAIMASVGSIPIRVERDVPGFLANRLQHALMREAYAILDEGVATPEDVDAAVRYGFGFRYIAAGPILQKDLAGLETNYRAGLSIYPQLNNATRPGRSIESLVEQGHYGTKTGRGFWIWSKDEADTQRAAYERTLIEAAKLLPQGAKPPSRG